MMKWNKLKHELVYTDSGYEIIFYLPSNLEEFGDELKLPKGESDEQKRKLVSYIKGLYPNITVQTVKFIAGTVIVASIILPSHPQNKIHAKPAEIAMSNNVTIIMGEYYIKPDVEPFIYKDRVMIPIRAISEVLGAEVSWDEKAKMATIKKDDNEIRLWVGSKWAVSNKTEYNMDAEPIIVSARTMVPMRFVAEAFGIEVEWNQKSKTVIIDYDKKYTLDYIVEAGDTLSKIAYKFGVSVDNIRLWNNIKGDIIYSGQFLRVASPALESISSSMDNIEIKEYSFDTVLGYTVRDYPSHINSYNSLSKYSNKLTEVSTFTHKLEMDGGLSVEYPQEDVIKLAKEKGLNAMMLIHNADSNGFSKELGKSVLGDDNKRSNLINNIYSQLKLYGYTGVEVDIENLPKESRQYYNKFIQELSEKLKPEGYIIACALPAKTSDTGEDWLRAYDYETIGKYADRVLIMSYDQHWSGGMAGPVASIEWVDKVVKYASSTIMPSKLVLGIPMYGYDWPVDGGKGKSVTTSTIKNYVNTYGGKIEWNESSKSPYYRYIDDKGTERIVWFENAQSTQFKFELAKKYGLKGVGMWRLGLEDGEFWTGLKTH